MPVSAENKHLFNGMVVGNELIGDPNLIQPEAPAKDSGRVNVINTPNASGALRQGADFFRELVSGEGRQTELTETLPELADFDFLGNEGGFSTGDKAKDRKILLSMFLTLDPEVQAQVIERQSPGSTFRDEKGNFFATDPRTGKQFSINDPGNSLQDFIGLVGQGSLFGPATKAALAMRSLFKKGAVGLGAGAATEFGSQKLQQGLGREKPVSIPEVGLAGLATPIGAVSSKAIPKGVAARAANEIASQGDEVGDFARQVIDAQDTLQGIEGTIGRRPILFPAQQTISPKGIAQQEVANEGGSILAASSLRNQNEEAISVVQDVINSIAPEKAVSGASGRIKSAADRFDKFLRKIRDQEANFGKVIDDAVESGVEVDLKPVKKLIRDKKKSEIIANSDTRLGKALNDVLRKLGGSKKDSKVLLVDSKGKPLVFDLPDSPTFRQIQRAKKEIDGVIKAKVDDIIDPSIQGHLVEVKEALLKQMELAHPPFKKARETFAKKSIPINQLEESALGAVSQTAKNKKDQIRRLIFDSSGTTTGDVKNVKKMIRLADPGAWDDIVRFELENRIGALNSAITEMGADSVQDIPKLYRQHLFGPIGSNKRKMLLDSVSDEQRKNLVFLDKYLSRAAIGRRGNPLTSQKRAVRQGLSEETNPATKAAKSILPIFVTRAIFGGAAGSLRALNTASGLREAGIVSAGARRLAEAAFNPKYQPDMKALRRLAINSKRSNRLISKILRSVSEDLGEAPIITLGAGGAQRIKEESRQSK